MFIGGNTAIIGDVAGHLGCFINLKDGVNAIAFVALGTSVPGRWCMQIGTEHVITDRTRGVYSFFQGEYAPLDGTQLFYRMDSLTKAVWCDILACDSHPPRLTATTGYTF